MIIYGVAFVLIISAAGIIGWLVVRHFPELVVLNVDSISEEKEGRIKRRILLEKLERNLEIQRRRLLTLLRPVGKSLGKAISGAYQKIQTLEQQLAAQQQPLQQIDRHQAIGDQLISATQLLEEGKLDEAEQAFIEVIKQDHLHQQAYESLARIYEQNRDYKQARETYRFLIKSVGRLGKNADNTKRSQLASYSANLGWVYQLDGKPSLAHRNYQKAVDLEPSNPRFLDLLLKISIMLKRKDFAQKAFSSLKEADPDNQKLDELQAQINDLPEPVVSLEASESEPPSEEPSSTAQQQS